ncbi:hypothetical protein A2524_01235 [Candidatus Wolfebacteria bacterium RIFOXYD12_FULL_48_21]|uniref:Phosphomannomutase n=1 Tax=Candidatus Wolfebacteria bacterium RIFOXYD1_FULL_48_65 TaxID=1802561 RepID=A0A1F8E242_9BACT|nr:MAG: hypothetical protein A2610_03180 [Candidatus Wolfebacteria bacterium RIFOXYD1_FULL_48_65]OGM94431.1 MAG: hypothetical protein A2524_01235 [Candidatus Wolfebacteria bacterium RIFOXYD12_FULL_48_21]OGM97384.1 MAG: hypothetical protein A2532_01875 [Candidatus Wolfebacteria bacterium RIFOXYD2_FULL_48_11]
MKKTSPFIDEYIDFLNGFLRDDVKTLDVVFDCSNGAAGSVIERLFSDSIILNGRPDGNFPNHAPDPLHAGSLRALQEGVVSNGADVGIIFDADGDRVFFIDDMGRFVDPDVVAYLLLWSLRPNRFVTDAKDGWLVRRQLLGAKRIAGKTGHYHIKQVMRAKDAEFGCERSGHYYFKNFFYCDSGIMAAVAVLNALARLPYALSEFVDLLPATYRSPEINVPISPSVAPAALFARIEAAYKKDAAAISKTDGIGMDFADPDWWFNVRLSNTEPLVRLNVEAQDKAVYDAQLKKLTYLLKSVT